MFHKSILSGVTKIEIIEFQYKIAICIQIKYVKRSFQI